MFRNWKYAALPLHLIWWNAFDSIHLPELHSKGQLFEDCKASKLHPEENNDFIVEEEINGKSRLSESSSGSEGPMASKISLSLSPSNC